MNPELLTLLIRQIAADYGLTAEDVENVRPQAQRILDTIARLDELPLNSVEPAPIFKVVP